MSKPTLFYFVHAHGNGHRATFNLLYPALSVFFRVIALTTNSEITGYLGRKHGVQVIELPPKYPPDYEVPAHTFSKAFEVTPYAIEPAGRAKALAEAIAHYKPKAFYCDGVPELAIMVRGMGVPVVLVHLPGNVMNDPTQVFAHELADHIVAHFPASLEQAHYAFTAKTYYSGYMSQYASHGLPVGNRSDNYHVTILLGYDNYDESVLKAITSDQNTTFTIVGNKQEYALSENCTLLGPPEHHCGIVVASKTVGPSSRIQTVRRAVGTRNCVSEAERCAISGGNIQRCTVAKCIATSEGTYAFLRKFGKRVSF
jgi:hypothetical protein